MNAKYFNQTQLSCKPPLTFFNVYSTENNFTFHFVQVKICFSCVLSFVGIAQSFPPIIVFNFVIKGRFDGRVAAWRFGMEMRHAEGLIHWNTPCTPGKIPAICSLFTSYSSMILHRVF